VLAVSLSILVANAAGKQWRGITPLKSSRADVESLLGKPNELGFYQIENDRAIIFYSGGQCENPDKCECLVPKDTVLRINVTLEYGTELLKFNLDNKRYTKDKAPYGPQSTYSDLEDGVVYTVNGSDKTVTAIDYWPSTKDCQEILTNVGANIPRNVWRGLMPLRSRRDEVERLLGPPKDSIGQTYIYETPVERVDVSYSEGACRTNEIGQWNVPTGTVLRIKVYPRTTTLVRDLPFDVGKYKRGPDPNIPDRFFYVNDENGVMIESEVRQGCEQVVNVTYEPTTKDVALRCPTNSKTATKKP